MDSDRVLVGSGRVLVNSAGFWWGSGRVLVGSSGVLLGFWWGSGVGFWRGSGGFWWVLVGACEVLLGSGGFW